MTESEMLRKQVQELRQQLQSSQAQTRAYLQNVAHQLTAPLGAIKWNIEALKNDAIPLGRKQNLLRSVYSQSTIVVHLIKNFSLMANLDADEELGQMRNQTEINLMLSAINLANDFQPQAAETEKKIQVDDQSFKTVFGSKEARVEKNLVAQALSNLLENAVKYADNRSTIYISAQNYNKDGFEGVSISVTSVGLPIGDSEKEHIFERGYRGVGAKKLVVAGTGIGLYLAARVMNLHQGKLIVETEGRKSQFKLIFPKSRLV